MVRFFVVFYLWICNKRGGFLSSCFSLDLFYCYRIFVSQNCPRKFVNQSRAAYQSDGGQKFRQRPPTSQRAVHAGSACWQCTQQAAHAASSARSKRCARPAWLAARAAAACAGLVYFRRIGNGKLGVDGGYPLRKV